MGSDVASTDAGSRLPRGQGRSVSSIMVGPPSGGVVWTAIDRWESWDTRRHRSVGVGQAGFEPTTSSSRTKRATKLRHCPSREDSNRLDP